MAGGGFIPDMTPPGTAPIAPAKAPSGGGGSKKAMTIRPGSAVSATGIHGSGTGVSTNAGAKPLQTKKRHFGGKVSGKKPLQNSGKSFRGRR